MSVGDPDGFRGVSNIPPRPQRHGPTHLQAIHRHNRFAGREFGKMLISVARSARVLHID
jgi:hypothetical protein